MPTYGPDEIVFKGTAAALNNTQKSFLTKIIFFNICFYLLRFLDLIHLSIMLPSDERRKAEL